MNVGDEYVFNMPSLHGHSATDAACAAADIVMAISCGLESAILLRLWHLQIGDKLSTSLPIKGTWGLCQKVGRAVILLLTLLGANHLTDMLHFWWDVDVLAALVRTVLAACAVVLVGLTCILALRLGKNRQQAERSESILKLDDDPQRALFVKMSRDPISTHETQSGRYYLRNANPALARLLDCAPSELEGKSLLDFVVAEDLATVKQAADQAVQQAAQLMANAGSMAKGRQVLPQCRIAEDPCVAVTYRLQSKAGQPITVESTLYATRQVCGDPVLISLVTNETLPDRVRQQLQAEKEALALAMKTRQRYISSITHDLKAPLHTFSLALDLLHDMDLNEEQRGLVQQAKTTVEFMAVTIAQAMDFSRIGTDGELDTSLKPRQGPVNVRHLMDKCAAILDGYPKQVPVGFKIAKGVDCDLYTDADWVWQMLLNLLTNSCKFTRQGQITLEVTLQEADGTPIKVIRNSATKGNAQVRFAVRDTGVGISREAKSKLFKAFGQSQAFQSQGTGLGLYSLAAKATRLGGTYGVEDNQPTGCVFFFTIPFVPAADYSEDDMARLEAGHGPATTVTPAPVGADVLGGGLLHNVQRRLSHNSSLGRKSSVLGSSTTSPRAGGSDEPLGMISELHTQPKDSLSIATPQLTRLPSDASTASDVVLERESRETTKSSETSENGNWVLIVDDTQSVRTLLGKAIRHWGYQVVDAIDGADGLAAMKQRYFSLVLCDLQMPILDGLECVRRYRQWESENRMERRRQPIVAASANCEPEGLQMCMDVGFDGFCPKPIKLQTLKEVVTLYCQNDARSDLRVHNMTQRRFETYTADGTTSQSITCKAESPLIRPKSFMHPAGAPATTPPTVPAGNRASEDLGTQASPRRPAQPCYDLVEQPAAMTAGPTTGARTFLTYKARAQVLSTVATESTGEAEVFSGPPSRRGRRQQASDLMGPTNASTSAEVSRVAVSQALAGAGADTTVSTGQRDRRLPTC